MRLSSITNHFYSQVHDAGSWVSWGDLVWNGNTPSNTFLNMYVRTGNTATPDGSWTSFQPIATSGDSVSQTGRYLQYRADFRNQISHSSATLFDVTGY